jgi:uncharacterized OsmC-like protein
MGSYDVRISTISSGEQAAAAGDLPTLTVRHKRAGPIRLDVGSLSGAHALHLAVAVCVFNDLVREAQSRGIRLESVVVSADGELNANATESTGIRYQIELVGEAPESELRQLAAAVEADAAVPSILRHGMPVHLSAIGLCLPPRRDSRRCASRA